MDGGRLRNMNEITALLLDNRMPAAGAFGCAKGRCVISFMFPGSRAPARAGGGIGAVFE